MGAAARVRRFAKHFDNRFSDAEEVMDDAAWARDLLQMEAVQQLIWTVPKSFAVDEFDRCDREVHRVDEVGVQELTYGGDPAADPHVLSVDLNAAIEVIGDRWTLLVL